MRSIPTEGSVSPCQLTWERREDGMTQQDVGPDQRLHEELQATRGGLKALVITVVVLAALYAVGALLLLG
jgi:hypothetical protein